MAAVEPRTAPTLIQPESEEENWDDDFEFGAGGGRQSNSQSHPRTPRKGTGYAKLSVGSRAETEDWDAETGLGDEDDHEDGHVLHARATTVHLTTSTATLRNLQPLASPPPPLPISTSTSTSAEISSPQATENWDDDFEDSQNSPQKTRPTLQHPLDNLASPSSIGSRITSPVESWDDDLELDAEFGRVEHDEEDRTVTARSRRARPAPPRENRTPPPLPSLSSTSFNHPHPAPPRSTSLGATQVFLAPAAPNSPASSASSIRGTVRSTGSNAPLVATSSFSPVTPPAHSTYASASAKVFALLPPSPQVHRERERRRLRKRSRPDRAAQARAREGVFELVEVEGRASREGWDADGYVRRSFDSERALSEEEEGEEDGQAVHDTELGVVKSQEGQHRPSTAPAYVLPGELEVSRTVPPTPTKHTLLSRIGSMKRWVGGGSSTAAGEGRVQRRRGMSAGADLLRGGGDARHSTRPYESAEMQRTPRPQSSLSSFSTHTRPGGLGTHSATQAKNYPYQHHRVPASPTPSPSPRRSNAESSITTTSGGGGWFFRAASRASSAGSPSGSARRGFRTRAASPGPSATSAADGDAETDGPASPASPASRRKLARNPSRNGSATHGQGGASRNRSRSPSRAPRTPRHSTEHSLSPATTTRPSRAASPTSATGGGSGHTSPATSPMTEGAPIRRRPSTRPPSVRGGGRTSLDFSASRTSLAMSMRIIEAEERERQQQQQHRAISASATQQLGVRTPARGRGYSVGAVPPSVDDAPRTPAKLSKRTSTGFVQLRRAMGGRPASDERGVELSKGTAGTGESEGESRTRYGGLGLGRAFGIFGGGSKGGGASGSESRAEESHEEGERPRRKSLSRLLRGTDADRTPQANTQAYSHLPPRTPTRVRGRYDDLATGEDPADNNNYQSKDKDKEGSRGFLGSVRRISLVGRHKRTKSGSGLGLASSPTSPSSPNGVPMPASPFFAPSSTRRTSGATAPAVPPMPYALPPLPGSESQVSLRLATASVGHLPLPPSAVMGGGIGGGSRRVVSSASSRSQSSSVVPASSSGASVSASTSASSSRNPSGNEPPPRLVSISQGQQEPQIQSPVTPTQLKSALVHRPSSRPSRMSDDEGQLPNRPSLGSAGRGSLDFESRIRKAGGKEAALSPGAGRETEPPTSMPLLPPIELQPPSPPQTVGPASGGAISGMGNANSQGLSIGSGLGGLASPSPATSSSSLFFTPTSSPHPPASPNNRLGVAHSPGKSPSQQSASLGRVAAATVASSSEGVGGESSVPRRNSLGDLKIPARISQAQVGIKRNLGMVKEFANNVEQLKEMQSAYRALVAQVQAIFEAHIQQHARQAQPAPVPRATSPSFFNNLSTLARPKNRARSYTNPNPGPPSASSAAAAAQQDAQLAYKEMAAMFYTINSKYRISWECAELLIELGGGAPDPDAVGTKSPPTSASAPFIHQAQAAVFAPTGVKSRERAITLSGDGIAQYASASSAALLENLGHPSSAQDIPGAPPLASPPPSSSWRASTGRHDLSQRQLGLLREMLNNSHAASSVDAEPNATAAAGGLTIPEEPLVNRDWRWGDARNSTITLPTEESGAYEDRRASTEHRRRPGRMGMAGIRDMLRALKRGGGGADAPMIRAAQSTTSLSTQSSTGSKPHQYPHPRFPSSRRKARESTGPETVRASRDLDPRVLAPPTGALPYAQQPTFVPPKPSPRRPSLASIFRIGNKARVPSISTEDLTAPPSSAQRDEARAQGSGTGEDTSSASEEDWDRMDSASDLDAAARAIGTSDGLATVRGGSQRKIKKGRSPYLQHDSFEPPPPLPLPVPSSSTTAGAGYSLRHALLPKRSFNISSTSLRTAELVPGSPHGSTNVLQRTLRLSNVEELADEPASPNKAAAHASVASPPRAVPPQLGASVTMPVLKESKLAMTPENIKPLLENAREVLAKLNDCIGEIQALVEQNGPSAGVIAA